MRTQSTKPDARPAQGEPARQELAASSCLSQVSVERQGGRKSASTGYRRRSREVAPAPRKEFGAGDEGASRSESREVGPAVSASNARPFCRRPLSHFVFPVAGPAHFRRPARGVGALLPGEVGGAGQATLSGTPLGQGYGVRVLAFGHDPLSSVYVGICSVQLAELAGYGSRRKRSSAGAGRHITRIGDGCHREGHPTKVQYSDIHPAHSMGIGSTSCKGVRTNAKYATFNLAGDGEAALLLTRNATQVAPRTRCSRPGEARPYLDHPSGRRHPIFHSCPQRLAPRPLHILTDNGIVNRRWSPRGPSENLRAVPIEVSHAAR